jgi:EAL domain-containing protein (putative c-di-GMP-specific phosphodiesterase class I)
VPPNVFIPAAENSGKIIELEKGVLTKVMKWLEQRAKSGMDLYQVAVNISVNHFFDPSFVSMLKNLAKKHKVDPKFLQLELTESIGLVDFASAKEIFAALSKAGFTVSVDDFGVGFSSLSYLSQLQVSELKIDRSFISSLDEADTIAVVMTIIQLANNLNLSTVAEGIEEEHHIEILLQLGCKIGQGFYYYKPMPFEKIDELLENE